MIPTDLNILVMTLFTWLLKVRFIWGNGKKFWCGNFRQDWITNFTAVPCIFLVWDYHMWSSTNIERKAVGLEPVINSHQFPVDSGMDIVHVTGGCKYCGIVSKINKTHMRRVFKWHWYIRKRADPNTAPCGTPDAMLDIK